MNLRPPFLRHGLSKTVISPASVHFQRTDLICAQAIPRRHIHQEHQNQHLDWPLHKNPTPYDILHLSPGAPYSKHNFYKLAKLYHPDRHHCLATTHSHLSPAVCVERYRLVVLANDILSNPSKRNAYDLYGAGWHLSKPMTNAMYREWRSGQHSPARNATWEDWEQWHDKRNGKKQEPVYMSHGSFAALLAFAISIGIVGQANRAGKMASNRSQLMQEKQGKIVGDLEKRTASSAAMGREERVASFIRDRENALWGFTPEKWEAPRPASK
ncbi:hypothetical protein jhhlp_008334 [Lomentospora prolificans]|uniref:J domain-containing protein n=1 Tax=Lomentospora prolificans TaxID=41688 RepID=A0A2N3MXR0_9PEZI|nr:hypothetical protein jhhlp_008334 [Lomentospora prolificans]